MSTPADELKAAAFQLRNPFHLPGLKVGIDPELASLLADWLDTEADLHADDDAATGDASSVLCENFPRALAVARQINAQP